MDVEAYIASGILELFVAGLLSEEENMEVYRNSQEHPRIKLEIESIEAAVLALTKTAAPKMTRRKGFDDLKVRIGQRKDTTVAKLPKEKSNRSAFIGWTTAILFGAGLFWFYSESSDFKTEIDILTKEKEVLEQQIFEARNSKLITAQLLNTTRDRQIIGIPLKGQAGSPEAYAKIYWDKVGQQVFIDALGLPAPADTMVYQVWALKLTPLSTTSLGLLEEFSKNEYKFFSLSNTNDSEAFGISLEPIGGSESPTMEQMYTQGNVPAEE